MKSNKCKNCTSEFSGVYCNSCGEKLVEPKDFKLKNILNNATGAIFSLDSKFLKTIGTLLVRPGQLSQKYISGLRKPYMKPFQVFVMANIFFFIFLNDIDIFRTPSVWYFQEEFDGIFVLDKVRAVCEERGITENEVAIAYDKLSGTLAKGLLLLIIPFIGLSLYILNIRKKMFFGEHVIIAVHFLSFFLVFSVLWTQLVTLLLSRFNRWFMIIPIMLSLTLWLIVGIKRIYGDKWIVAILKGIAAVLFIGFFIQAYRAAISALSLNLV